MELGITHLDTSDFYGPHTNEVLVGEHFLTRLTSLLRLPGVSTCGCVLHSSLHSRCAVPGKAIQGRRDRFTVATKFGIYNEKGVRLLNTIRYTNQAQ